MSGATASGVNGEAGAPAAGAPTWDDIRKHEKAAIEQRRSHAAIDAELPRAGLALSGGGIRSATFCLGLMRGLAQNGILRRFDYLSTVSGGGYAGSSVGRIAATHGIDATEKALAAGDSIVLAWLRRNGRYLTPEGARDFGMAIATYLRGGLSTHLEIGLLATLVGLIAIAPHVVQTTAPLFAAADWRGWWSGWWPICTGVWLLLAPGGIVAFWPLRESETAPGRAPRHAPGRELGALTAIAIAAAGVALPSILPAPGATALIGAPSLRAAAFLVFAGCVGRLVALWGRLGVQLRRPNADPFAVYAHERNRLTRSLRRVNKITAALFALGVLDVLTWRITGALGHVGSSWMIGGIGLGGVIALLLRTFSEPLQKISASADGVASRWLPQIVNVVGIAIGLLVLVAWIVLLQWLVFDPDTIAALRFLPPAARAGLLCAVIVAWYMLTLSHRQTVNASSLHGFYQARLTRAYLSLGNLARFATIGAHAAATAAVEAMRSVTDVVAGDDVALGDYSPEARGGPIHLINTCLNQTVDDHGELYNADRKGANVVASARGIEVGTATFLAPCGARACGSLGHWVAMSGAATSPGAGSYTTTGWSLLLFLAGARLGYWIDAAGYGVAARKRARGLAANVVAAASGWLRETKPGLLACEALASFGGRARRWWYLSDGGHFDNTGVYALLRRELPFILLADCGADPKFDFADLENLVRKARIDFDAEIELYTRVEAQQLLGAAAADLCVLAPEDMLDNQSVRGVLLARVCYHRSDPQRRRIGTLLIVKPNLHEALDNDVLAYARRNPLFPQQPTSDQFFDEAQWESYHHLGEDFGRALTGAWLGNVPGWTQPIAVPSPLLPLRRSAPVAAAATPAANVPFWRRGAAATALSTTLGLGAIGTLLLPGWQMFDELGKERAALSARDAAQKQTANIDLDDVEDDVRRALADDTEPSDVSSTVARKLGEMYEATHAFPHDPQLRYVDNLVGEVQSACRVEGSTCPDLPAQARLLCSAVCTNPVASVDDPYWAYPRDSDGVWKKNIWVRLADSAGLLHLRSQEDIAAATATARPSSVVRTADAGHAEPTSTAPATADAGNATTATSAAATPTAAAAPPAPPAPTSAPSARSSDYSANGAAAVVVAAAVRSARAAAAGAAPDIAACRGAEGSRAAGLPITIFTQIYDEVMRPRVDSLRESAESATVRFAGIENVTRTAAAPDAKSNRQWQQPTLIVHRTDDLPCARAVAERLQRAVTALYGPDVDAQIRIRGLPPSFKSDRHVLELWLPPGQPALAQAE